MKTLLALLLLVGVANAQTLPCTGTIAVSATGVVSGSCTGGPPPTQPPAGCTITGLPSGTQQAPYAYSLGSSCASGGTPTAWKWSGGSTATTPAISGSITATTSFGMVASNSAGSAPQANGSITVGGSGPIACAGFNNTHVAVIPWGPPGSSNQQATGGAWGANDAYVVQFTTPNATSSSIGSIAATEYQTGPFYMATKLSATPCDFTNPGVSQSPNLYYQVTNQVGTNLLKPATTYYWNMKHYQSGGGQAIIILTQPPGL